MPPPRGGAGAARDLTGDLQQVPPMVSAKKVDGRLHELARRRGGRRPRSPVTVTRFDVEATDDPMVVGAVELLGRNLSGSRPRLTSVTLWAGSPPGRASGPPSVRSTCPARRRSSSSRRIRPPTSWRPPPSSVMSCVWSPIRRWPARSSTAGSSGVTASASATTGTTPVRGRCSTRIDPAPGGLRPHRGGHRQACACPVPERPITVRPAWPPVASGPRRSTD